MPRLKGRTYPQAFPQRSAARQTQIREQLAAGVEDPAVIAKAMGVSKEAVLYHVRQMPDVTMSHDRKNRRRITLALSTATTTEDADA